MNFTNSTLIKRKATLKTHDFSPPPLSPICTFAFSIRSRWIWWIKYWPWCIQQWRTVPFSPSFPNMYLHKHWTPTPSSLIRQCTFASSIRSWWISWIQHWRPVNCLLLWHLYSWIFHWILKTRDISPPPASSLANLYFRIFHEFNTDLYKLNIEFSLLLSPSSANTCLVYSSGSLYSYLFYSILMNFRNLVLSFMNSTLKTRAFSPSFANLYLYKYWRFDFVQIVDLS